MEKKKVNVYQVEKLIGEMLSMGKIDKYKEIGMPKLIMDNEIRLRNEKIKKHPNIEEAYREYVRIKGESKIEVVGMCLTEDNDYIGKDENGEYRVTSCVYKVVNKECKRNIYGGILFDSEWLAIAYWYKDTDTPHPEFDKMIRAGIESPEDKLLRAIFGGEKK